MGSVFHMSSWPDAYGRIQNYAYAQTSTKMQFSNSIECVCRIAFYLLMGVQAFAYLYLTLVKSHSEVEVLYGPLI
jgi:hypothetical protein